MGLRILTISGELFPQFFSLGEKHYRIVKDALPSDVKIRNVQLISRSENVPQDVAFLLESGLWDGPPMGEKIPDITPMITSLYPKDGEFKPWEPD